MLPVLLRIRPDEWLAARFADGVPVAGVWVLLVLWAVYCGVSVWLARKADRLAVADGAEPPAEEKSQWTIAAVGAAGLLSLPLWIGAVLPADFAGVPIFGYGVMIFCGFAAGVWTGSRRVARAGLPAGITYDLAFWTFVCGIGGARLNYLVRFHDRVFAAPDGSLGLAEAVKRAVNLADGGLILLGGVMGAAAAFAFVCRKWRVPVLRVADAAIPSCFLGLAFGRVGCLLYGCCWGDRCELPWAVHFPAGGVTFDALAARGFLDPDAPRTYGLHPTQLYSAFNALVLYALTAAYFPRRPRDGAVLCVALLLYPPARATLEVLRGDDLGFLKTGFTLAQTNGAALFLCGLALAGWLAFSPRPSGGDEGKERGGGGGRRFVRHSAGDSAQSRAHD